MLKPKATTISQQKNSYLISSQRGQPSEQQYLQGRNSFTLQESYQDDIIHLSANESGKNSSKKLNHAQTINYESQGGDSSTYLGSQQMIQVSKKTISKSNAPLKKKGTLQQLPPKQQGVNLVNLNLNFSSVPQTQLPPTYPLMKNQENIQNSFVDGNNNPKKKKLLQQQYEPVFNQMKGPQQNYNPNRLQKIQTLQPKLTSQIQQNYDESLMQRGYLIDQQSNNPQLGLVDLNSSSSVLTNSTNLTKNTLQNSQKQSLYQVSEILQDHSENRNMNESDSPYQTYNNQMTSQNEMISRIPCNHKKGIKEIVNSQIPKQFGQGLQYQLDNRSNRVDSNVLDPSISQHERIERMMKNLDMTATKVLQLKNKSIGTLESNRGTLDQQQLQKQRQTSQEQYDDTYLYNNQSNAAPIPSKNKQFYQQNQKGGLQVTINSNSQKTNYYGGVRNEPSSHQFLAIKSSDSDNKLKQSFNTNQFDQINQIIEMDVEQSIEGIRESFILQKNQIIAKNRRQASNSVSREFEASNLDYSENLKTFGVSLQQLQLQKKDLLNYKNFKTQQNQGLQEQNQQLIAYDPSSQFMENTQQQVPLFENKKTNRKIINANPSSKQEVNKRYSGVIVSTSGNASKQKPASSNSQNTLMTQQQKDRLQKNDKDNQLQMKIKIYLDFQRIINFSNNMTMQLVPANGVKLYKAHITKGNNGVLIRAALKNRWWWSLSESSEDYDNLNFLWTQWRKPQFFKMIKSRSELSLTQAKDEEQQNNNLDQTKIQINQNNESILQGTDEAEDQKINIDNNKNGENIIQNEFSDQVQEGDTLEQEKQEITSPLNNERPGYNDASPSKNLQDYMTKSTSKKQNQGSNSPFGRKGSMQLSPSDPFSKIGALVNEKDLQLIMNYTKQSKKKKLNPIAQVPPVFNKEEYEQGIEKEYEKMRRDSGVSINIFKNPQKQKMHNHMEFNFHLANKKALYYNMKQYYILMNQSVFDSLPVTFHIQHGLNDPEFNNFSNFYNKFEAENPKRKNVWIIKPGESSNRGNGIQVAGDINSVRDIIRIRESHQNGFKKTYIIQQYIDRPFLYNKRKFDIRCFMLMTNYNNTLKAYWYIDGYIRTSTKEFTLKNLDNRMIHLTNEAVQKRGDDFGKFENGNKLSYLELQKYIDVNHPNQNFNFMQQVYPQMKKLAYDSVCSVYTKIDKKKRNFSFELFGLDYMIDDQFRTWLIEINTNPSLTIAAPLMSRLLPALIDNVLKIAIDPIFPPPNFPKSKKHLIPEQIYENNKFELLFDSDVDGQRIQKLYQNISNKIDEQLEEDCKNEEVYDDDDAEVDQEDEENEEEGC